MTTIKDVIKLAEQQENGAALEVLHVDQDDWQNVYAPLDECNLDNIRKVRLKAPGNIPRQLEWTGAYDVPTKDNCDAWIDFNKLACTWTHCCKPGTSINNGYRYLLRKKVPQVVPYTLETFVLKSSHVKTPIRLCSFDACDEGIVCSGTLVTWGKARDGITWPDGSPFGVVQEVKA